MTRCHAFWSFGTVAGAILGGAFAERGIGFLTPAAGAAAAVRARRRSISRSGCCPTTRRPRREPERGFALPSAALLDALPGADRGAPDRGGDDGVVGAPDARVEGGGAVRHRADLRRSSRWRWPVIRLAGDRLAELFGPRPVIWGSGAGRWRSGIVGFALAPGLWMSIPAAVLIGIGCGNIYPLTMSMVGQVPGPRPERNVATLALVAFTAFLIGPPADRHARAPRRAAGGDGAARAARARAGAAAGRGRGGVSRSRRG